MEQLQTTELAIALDFPDGESALKLVRNTQDLKPIFKIGSELFLAVGPDWVRDRVKEGARVFLDLKFHDIPNTVAKSSLRALDLGVEMFTLHLAGGPQMIELARDEMDKKANGGPRPKILGVSVLTSFDQPVWDEVSFAIAASKSSIEDSVKRLVSQARYWGVDGIVCSPYEIGTVTKIDPVLYSVVPGIRPVGAARGDQARVMTPGMAASLGAKLIVVGRPITGAPDPRDATQAILDELGAR